MKLGRFSGLSARNLLARPQRTLLTAVGIVLGVGIVFGVLALSDTMSGSFSELYSRAYGSADLSVTAAGGSGAYNQKVLKKVRSTPGVEAAAPRLAEPASIILPGKGEGASPNGPPNGLPEVQSAQLYGAKQRSAALATGFEVEKGRFPKSGAEIALDVNSAKSAGFKLGDGVRITTPGGSEEMRLVGLLRSPGGSFGGIAYGTLPLSFAQRTFGAPGGVSNIAVNAKSSTSVTNLRTRLDRKLGSGFEVERAETRTQQVTDQFQVFRLALLFFAGTALFVGAFLVFNALSMTVLERTRELGMLRALGSTRAMIARSVVLEAALLGTLGSALGIALGYAMAWGLVYLFGQAFLLEISSITVSPFALISAVVVGILVTSFAALYPALRAGRVSPVEAMRSRSGSGSSPKSSRLRAVFPLAGIVLTAGCGTFIYYLAKNLAGSLAGPVLAAGIAAVVGAFLGFSLIIPALVRPLATLFSPILRLFFGVEGRMAAANATRNRGRTALTASALMVGIALVIAFSALGGSVLGSIRANLENSLGSDYVIQPPNPNSNEGFSNSLMRKVSAVPGVETTTSIASSIHRDGDRVSLVFGLDRNYPRIFTINYASGGPRSFQKLFSGEALVGKQLAGSKKLHVGSRVRLATAKGEKSYRVAGIIENDVLGGGSGVYLSKKTLARDFAVNQAQFLAVKARPGSGRHEIFARISSILQAYPQFALYSNAQWKAQIVRDFNRQYVFFYAIMGISVAVSAFGVVNTLSMSVFERTREIGILRAVGTTRLQIGRLIVDEGIVISLTGCLIGVAVGSLLGYLFVLGTGAGGFDVSFFYPKLPALAALFSGLVIGALAGLLPARNAAKKDIVEAVQYE